MKNIVIISSSYRIQGNSDLLSDAFMKGAIESGNKVDKISLRNLHLQFCRGCLVCQKSGECIINDDANAIVEKMIQADVIVFATPVYFYEMSGQMKTLLDRTNPAYVADYRFRDIYLLVTAAEEKDDTIETLKQGLQGWIECFEKATLKGVVKGLNVTNIDDIKTKSAVLQEAYALGKIA